MESYLYIEDQLDDILNAITFSRLKIIHTSIISPEDLITSLQEISQNLHQNSLPLFVKSSNIARYLDIIELEALQTDSDLIFVLRIPLIDQQVYRIFQLFPIPIFDNRTGLYHILSTSQKYIARDDDSLIYTPLTNLERCKQLYLGRKICSNLFAYPIDSNAICEARILRSLQALPENCQTSLIFAKGYNVHQLADNSWLIINSEPLQITINCHQRNSKTEIIFKNSILKLQPYCNAFVGATKVQANSRDTSEITVDAHPIQIPYNCCENIPDNIQIPKLKPLKLNNLNVEDLEIAKHKLDEYSKTLDDLMNEPFVTKHISWFTYFTITLIIVIIIFYILCKCRRKKRLALALSTDSPPPPPRPSKPFRSFASILPRRRPSIRPEDRNREDEEIELN